MSDTKTEEKLTHNLPQKSKTPLDEIVDEKLNGESTKKRQPSIVHLKLTDVQ